MQGSRFALKKGDDKLALDYLDERPIIAANKSQLGRFLMRSFIFACAAIVIAPAAALVLSTFQKPVEVAFVGDGVRI